MAEGKLWGPLKFCRLVWVISQLQECGSPDPAGFEVVAALCLEDLAQACTTDRFDVAIVGYAFSIPEKAQFVRCLQGVFQLPVHSHHR